MSLAPGSKKWLALCVWAIAACCASLQGQQTNPRPKVLLLTHAAGARHEVTTRATAAEYSLVEQQLLAAAEPHLDLVVSQDCKVINPENLKKFSAVIFFTSGDLPISPENRAALIQYVYEGGGFVGIHSAAATWKKIPEYQNLIGARFDGHPWNQEVTLKSEDRRHAGSAAVPHNWTIEDEIYQFDGFDRRLIQVLLSLDIRSVDATLGARSDQDYPLVWAREFAHGRVFYSALGHRPEMWANKFFLNQIVQGTRWTLGELIYAPAPKGEATPLFQGRSLSNWRHPSGPPPAWFLERGAMEVRPGSGSLITRSEHRNFHLHVEFRLPPQEEEKNPKANGNSGVYLQQRYEIQILDSFGSEPKIDGCGSLYRYKAPDRNVCRRRGVWQYYDIYFRAPVYNSEGEKQEHARVTVVHNGFVIHDDVELTRKTGAGQPEGPSPGPILLQDHGSPVRFRNLWLRELE